MLEIAEYICRLVPREDAEKIPVVNGPQAYRIGRAHKSLFCSSTQDTLFCKQCNDL